MQLTSNCKIQLTHCQEVPGNWEWPTVQCLGSRYFHCKNVRTSHRGRVWAVNLVGVAGAGRVNPWTDVPWMATKEDSCVKNRNPNRVLLMHKQLFNEKVAMVVLGVYMTPCQLHFSERARIWKATLYTVQCTGFSWDAVLADSKPDPAESLMVWSCIRLPRVELRGCV